VPVTFSIASMRPRSATCASRAWRTRPVNAWEENRRHLFHDALVWEVHLSVLKIEGPRHRQLATKGARSERSPRAACTSGSPLSAMMPVSSMCCGTRCAVSTRSA
jgi:hypothetical protein